MNNIYQMDEWKNITNGTMAIDMIKDVGLVPLPRKLDFGNGKFIKLWVQRNSGIMDGATMLIMTLKWTRRRSHVNDESDT